MQYKIKMNSEITAIKNNNHRKILLPLLQMNLELFKCLVKAMG
jgi:hypothetical protein